VIHEEEKQHIWFGLQKNKVDHVQIFQVYKDSFPEAIGLSIQSKQFCYTNIMKMRKIPACSFIKIVYSNEV
jgi:hypothetical protein